MRRRRRRKTDRLTRFQAGMLGILAIILISYAAYTKFANPFANPFTVHATFSSANGLVAGAPVRIAGVNVGKVTSVSAVGSDAGGGKQAADVSMAIQSNGLPIHQDATFWIRPRIFLEGNFFVDLHPGSPSAPIAGDGHTFPIQQGEEPVQLDQVLSSLQANTRHNLQVLVTQYGKAVKVGGPAYNRSIQFWLPAYKYSAIVAHDALGLQPHDLSTWIDKMGVVAGAIDRHPQNLQNLITDLNTTAAAFARENTNLQAAVAELPRTLAVSIPAFNALNAAFPPLREFARTLLPGVQSTGPAIDASLPFIDQLRQLVQPSELGGLTSDLAVTVPALAKLTRGSIPLMKNGVRPVASCVVNDIYPWSQLTLDDGVFSGKPGYPMRKVFQEAVDYLPGLAGESRVFDANGPYIRVLGNGGTIPYSLGNGLVGESLTGISGAQPPLAPSRPPLESGVPCETQAPISDLTSGSRAISPARSASTPGADLFAKSAALAAISAVSKLAGQQGMKTNVTSQLAKELGLP
jgi:ABC-type transporter Mla subunit MlaD